MAGDCKNDKDKRKAIPDGRSDRPQGNISGTFKWKTHINIRSNSFLMHMNVFFVQLFNSWSQPAWSDMKKLSPSYYHIYILVGETSTVPQWHCEFYEMIFTHRQQNRKLTARIWRKRRSTWCLLNNITKKWKRLQSE